MPSIDPVDSMLVNTRNTSADIIPNGTRTPPLILASAATLPIPVASTSTSTPSISLVIKDKEKEKEKVVIDKDLLPHPAEDLSADDDLLSWMLVDQLGCMPNTKLGVHPQQVKFVGPTFKTDDVLNIIKETITKGNIQGAMQRLQEFPLIKSHMDSKMTDYQRERFVAHLRRYLLPLAPNSRLEIHLTSRYSFVTGHTELAIFATKPLTPGLVMQELQGSVVPLPDQWREEMEIGEDFAVAVEAAGEETDSENGGSDHEADNEDNVSLHSSLANDRRDKGKSKEVENKARKGQRRSDRTKRRDFSIVWSGLKRCYQLFLGPARFLNHDCNPNVELLRQGKYVTFRILKPIRVGDELTTFYGENYFGRDNIECLCLTCEQKGIGGFTPASTAISNRNSRSGSRDSSAGPSSRGTSAEMRESVSRDVKNVKPSALRNVLNGHSDEGDASDDEQSSFTGAESRISGELDADAFEAGKRNESLNGTPTKKRPISLKITLPASPASDSVVSDPESPLDPPPRRERIVRKVVQNIKPWSFLQRPKKARKNDVIDIDEESTEVTDDLPSDFPRCGTCAKPLNEQIWFNGRYFEHCARCIRHAFIFELPWPAHNPKDVREYPPSHLVPPGYIPRKISTIPLPTLSKQPKYVKPVEVPVSPANETKSMRRARMLRNQIAAEEFYIESLRETAWSAQEAHEAAIEAKEAAIKAAKEAKEEKRLARIEEKRKRDALNIKGTGVWSRYAYVTEEELKRKEAERNQVLSGTRRGGSFRARKEEEEMKKLAEERMKEEERERLAGMGIDPSSSPTSAAHPQSQTRDDAENEQPEEDDESNVSIRSSSASSTVLVVDPKSIGRRYISSSDVHDEDDEMEVAKAPELSIVSKLKLESPRTAVTSPAPKIKVISRVPQKVWTSPKQLKNPARSSFTTATTTPFRAIAPKRPANSSPSTSSSTLKTTPARTFNASNIIDLTLDSDDDDGTPPPSKRLSSGYSRSTSMKHISRSSAHGQINLSPVDRTIHKSRSDQSVHAESSSSDRRSTYPVLNGTASGRKSDGSGSSSVDATERALDVIEEKSTNLTPIPHNNMEQSNVLSAITDRDENKRTPKVPLNLAQVEPKPRSPDQGSQRGRMEGFTSFFNEGRTIEDLNKDRAKMRSLASISLIGSGSGSGSNNGKGKDHSPKLGARAGPSNVQTKSLSSSTGATSNGQGMKRKRVSDSSAASSSASPSAQNEKKKRTFFPSSINVPIASDPPTISKSKHPIHRFV
ncbi:uncharacterized protein I303_101145 [Kwoniella dejecticola CBS 10117]|uniref:SET domain-containing protein n=1 Tax=Kwoniella dejecticola CBS 10117 TaxID=1296121 RepID=A0A1A6AGX0_9TREE|nr:uncharacterized protein I303_01151 [Kwoniella dejecticola CBS 10117]OBR89325.1 hypothetical protein I303_01151 [Kwoniella dejecticola CBS 10117]